MEPENAATIEPPANVLLVHTTQCESDACGKLCHETGPTADLRVTFADTDPEQPDADSVDGKVGLLTIGDILTADSARSALDFAEPVVVDSVQDPTDLSEIGVAISRFCKHWSDTDEQITVCFDSLDALLRHTSPKKVFEFTHVLTNRLESVDAYAHFHFDPTHHEDRVVSTFGTIFDSVVVDGDAEDSIPEATDEEVAALLSSWTEESESALELEAEPSTEATDEDIARILGK